MYFMSDRVCATSFVFSGRVHFYCFGLGLDSCVKQIFQKKLQNIFDLNMNEYMCTHLST